MAFLYLLLALVLQSSLTLADDIDVEKHLNRDEILKNTLTIDEDVRGQNETSTEWMDIFNDRAFTVYPTMSATMMAHAFKNESRTPEEQIENIKDIANSITAFIENEMTGLLAYAMSNYNKQCHNSTKTKRSVESPMDSSKMVMRLLKHIKSSNEYQNIAIEKMMSAQEIADKYGIAFTPDTEVLSDLAVAANQQTHELSTILKDACDYKNVTNTVEFVPLDEKPKRTEAPVDNQSYYSYSVHQHQPEPVKPAPIDHIHGVSTPVNHVHYADPHSNFKYYQPYEGQQMSPVPQYSSPPVSQKPNFYESYSPVDYYYTPCSMEPLTTTTIVLPYEELVEPEPELIGEEIEETVTSKVVIDHDDPDVSTLNHVMTYTVSEKSHFRHPQVNHLPQQMQYYFFMV